MKTLGEEYTESIKTVHREGYWGNEIRDKVQRIENALNKVKWDMSAPIPEEGWLDKPLTQEEKDWDGPRICMITNLAQGFHYYGTMLFEEGVAIKDDRLSPQELWKLYTGEELPGKPRLVLSNEEATYMQSFFECGATITYTQQQKIPLYQCFTTFACTVFFDPETYQEISLEEFFARNPIADPEW